MTSTNLSQAGATQMPDAHGSFGEFGGIYAPVTLIPAIQELQAAYDEVRRDPSFQAELDNLLDVDALTRGGRTEPV